MPGSGAAIAYGSGMAGSENGNLETVVIVGSYTTSTEAYSETKGQTGWSIGTFSSGQATLTFPTHLSALGGFGCTSIDNRFLVLSTIDLSAGTATLNFQTNDGTQGDPGTSCTVYLFLTCVRK